MGRVFTISQRVTTDNVVKIMTSVMDSPTEAFKNESTIIILFKLYVCILFQLNLKINHSTINRTSNFSIAILLFNSVNLKIDAVL